jgi:hypothetical protein
MKKWAGLFLAAALILPALMPSRAQSAIIISELCDPLNNYLTDRYIEVANAGTDTVDLAGWTLIALGPDRARTGQGLRQFGPRRRLPG